MEEKVSTAAFDEKMDSSKERKSRLAHLQTRKTSSRKVMMLAFGTHQTRGEDDDEEEENDKEEKWVPTSDLSARQTGRRENEREREK